MTRRQFVVLYREFLFRIVDRELLSSHAKGDTSQLLLQIIALLVFLSAGFSVPILGINTNAPAQAQLVFAWSVEHFLIATTMLVVGVFAVMSWGSMFPDHRDVLVLAPLPVRAHTVLLAKVAAIATALGVAIVSLHAVAGLLWPLALGGPAGGVSGVARFFVAYWLTMTTAGVFVFGVAMGAQGLLASLLPYRYFLRASSFLQLGAFGLIVSAFCFQSIVVTPSSVATAQQGGRFGWSPSYWFLGLFQTLNGSTAFASLARTAWIGVSVAIVGTALACSLAYVRTLRRIAEEPDISPGAVRLRRLPPFGRPPQTAVVQFSLRTLFRSAQHRVILAFYWGIGLAITAVFLKAPRARSGVTGAFELAGWQAGSVPLLGASVLMLGVAVLAARLAFAMPRDLGANWIFRVLPVQSGPCYLAARRRALLIVAIAPVWLPSAIAFLLAWPWRPAVGHLAILALLGLGLVELALRGTQKIPFTCSYLPGKSRIHVSAYVASVLLLPAIFAGVELERDALGRPWLFAALLATLGALWFALRWSNTRAATGEGALVEFEDEPSGQPLSLDVWDSRFLDTPARPSRP